MSTAKLHLAYENTATPRRGLAVSGHLTFVIWPLRGKRLFFGRL
ncbi:MAG TPA: hypothetical protein VGJ21_15720 [Terracidiphilus sp.]